LLIAQGASAEEAPAGSAGPLDNLDNLLLPKVSVEDTKFKAPTSPKFTEPLRDTPQTIVVVPSTVYSAQGASTLSDVLRNTPGITFAAGEGGSAAATAGDAFYLRGFDTSSNIFVDGVRDVGSYSRDVFNFESVEIAKGSAATDVGRSASSGYINLITKLPRLEAATTIDGTYGWDEETSQTRRRVTVDSNQPVANSPVAGTALRLNAMWQDSGAVARNDVENRSWGIAPSLALGLGTPTHATVTYEHLHENNTPDYGLPTPAFPGYPSTPASPAIDWTTFYGFTADYDRVTADAVTGRVEHDFGPGFSLSNQTRYSRVDREAVVTGPGSSATSYVPATGLLTRSRQGNKRATDIASNQTNFTARATTAGVQHDLSGGVELSRENAYSPTFTSATLVPIAVANPVPTATPGGSPVRSGAWSDTRTDTLGIYGFDTLKLGRRWELSGGLRLDHFTTDFVSLVAGATSPTALLARGDLLTWKTGLVFKPAKDTSLYVSYGISYKPPGTDFTLSSVTNNQNNPDLDPQKTTNAEIGAKREFYHGRLLATVSLFQMKNNRTVFTDPVLGAIPAGAQTVKGSEFDLTGKLSDDWLILAGVSWLDSVYNNGTAAQVCTSLPLTPKWSGNLWTTYRLPRGFTIGAGTQYRGEANRLDATTTVPRTMPAFWLANAMLAYDVTSHFTLRLNVNNLGDTHYVLSFNNNGARFAPGAPRNYLLTAELKF
jgi:catecholate siderophore receptor